MEPFKDDSLVSALESLRPQPRAVFAAELDERAAGGFPRRAGGSALRRLVERLRSLEPRRALIPTGATALACIAALTAVIAVSEEGGKEEESAGEMFSLESPGVTFDAEVAPKAAGEASGRLSNEETAASAGGEMLSAESGPYASQAPRREIERSAQLVIGADSAGVRKAASDVFETVHAYRGIVLNSSIRDGEEGEAGARFAVLIPSAKLGDAMADFSAIGEVRSRREATADITAPTVRTGELLRDSRAKIEGLLTQLAQAATDAERTATEAKLRAERRNAAYLRSQLSSLERRANFSRVGLQIESGAPGSATGESGWGVDDALGDAGHILAIAAAVTIVGLAILGPIALIALLAWLANRARVKRARHRALA
jgi:Domain of unknown function (DUF4349)